MSRRRRRRPGVLSLAAVLLVGALAGAIGFSVLLRTRETPAPIPERPEFTVEVLNGCGVEGAADRVASRLRRNGYRVESVGNAGSFHYRGNLVVDRRGMRKEAEALATLLDEPVEVVVQRREGDTIDITVIVGTPHPLVPE